MQSKPTDFKADFTRLAHGAPAPGPEQVALVPGEEVPVLRLDLPDSLRGSTREQVARRQLLDMAALREADTEIRPLLLAGGADSWSRALVADRAAVTAWREAAGEDCRAVLPDYLALATTEGLWTIAVSETRVVARLGVADGFSADPALARLMLERALNALEDPPRAVLWQGVPSAPLSALFAAAVIPVVTEPAALAELGLETPSVLGHGELALDLRRDPFATRARLRRRIMPWRLPALIALAAAVLWGGAQVTATRAITDELRAERARALDLTRQYFVPAGPVLDIRAQVSRQLAEARAATLSTQAETSGLALFGLAADALAGPGVELQQVAYATEDGLRLGLRLPDFASGERLAATLRDAGLAVEVVRSEASDTAAGVQLDLRLNPGGGRP